MQAYFGCASAHFGCASAILDLVTVEDWDEEIFTEGVGVTHHTASAPTLYHSSIQLQSKMAASKT